MKKKIKKFAGGGEPLNLSDEARGVLNLETGTRMTKDHADYWSKNPKQLKLLNQLANIDFNAAPVLNIFGRLGLQRPGSFIFNKATPMKKGGKVTTKTKKHKCTRGDGCAKRGKTKGRIV